MRQCLLLIVAAGLASGCGVLLDLDPPEDAGGGMDGSLLMRDGGPDVECVRDDECDNGRICDGVESCALGVCVDGFEVECDDGIECTDDTCSEAAGGCEAEPLDELCPDRPSECATTYCDVDLGCRPLFDDSACDDGIECTLDVCSREGTCSSTRDDASCPDLEYCELEPVEGAIGCRPIPSACVMDDDCVELICSDVFCDPSTNMCVYTDIEMDPGCTVGDECRPAVCIEGTCAIRDAVTCREEDRASCVLEQCARDELGAVHCEPGPREGSCSTMACYAGTCGSDGTCLESFTCPDSSDPCQVPLCSGGGCTFTPVTCGDNATCMTVTADARCVCDPGFHRCGDGTGNCCVDLPDAGVAIDSGPPMGADAGYDGGPVVLPDAGYDAGTTDAGYDAGTGTTDAGTTDAGTTDAGTTDAGYDSGGVSVVDAAISTLDAGTVTCAFPMLDCGGGAGCTCDQRVSMCSRGACVCREPCRAGQVCCMGVRRSYCADTATCTTPAM